jgi:ceramide glucosyltransferase
MWSWAPTPLSPLEWLLLLPVAGGSLYSLACLAAMARLKAQARALAQPGDLAPAQDLDHLRHRAHLQDLHQPRDPAQPRNPGDERLRHPAPAPWPAVTLLKPVCGLEKGLRENLLSACAQDYPGELQVIFSAQDEKDPAVPLLRQLQQELGPDRVEVVVDSTSTAPNGKIRNLLGAYPHARHDLLVISDSDVRLRPDYLRAIVAPFLTAGARLGLDADSGSGADPRPGAAPTSAAVATTPAIPVRAERLSDPAVGCACTFYRAAGARRWFEALEQLTLNADFVPNLVFAEVTGASRFLLGASTALSRTTLAEIGGLAALSDYLVEDNEMGRRILAAGKHIAVVPYFVDTMVDLRTPGQWWHHQVYWDQNTRSANPWGHFGTLFVRAVPFALLFALARTLRLAHAPDAPDSLAAAVLAGALALRLAAAGLFMGWGLGDRTGVRNLAWLPLRDLAGLVSAVLAFTRPTVVWRGVRFLLTRDGRMVPQEPAA